MNQCKCERRELRKRIAVNGTVHYRLQCLTCGHTGQSIKRETLTQEEMANAPLVDQQLQRDYWKRQSEAAQQEWEAKRAADFEARLEMMNQYYSTAEWRAKRQLVLERDNWTCQANLPGCNRTARQVHHVTYAHFGNEPLFDLVSVCVKCHEQITAIDRIRRGIDMNQPTSPSTASSMFN